MIQKFFAWLKDMLSEHSGEASSIRVSLVLVTFSIVGVTAYLIVRHVLDKTTFDIGPNLANLLSVSVGALAAGKTVQRTFENNEPK